MRLEIASLVILSVAAPLVAQTPDTNAVTAIRAGRLVDPSGGTVSRNQIILIRGKKITEVGPNLTIPPGARVVDLSKQTVLPGLFDAHTHLCMTVRMRRDNANYFYTTLNGPRCRPRRRRGGQCPRHAPGRLHHRAGRGERRELRLHPVRRAIEQGRIPGPTVINAGRIIAPYGGQFQPCRSTSSPTPGKS
jgi:imidazolonepropionase-like amidohydrolase